MNNEGSGFAWGGYDDNGKITQEAKVTNKKQRVEIDHLQMSDNEAYEHFKHIYTRREFNYLRRRLRQ